MGTGSMSPRRLGSRGRWGAMGRRCRRGGRPRRRGAGRLRLRGRRCHHRRPLHVLCLVHARAAVVALRLLRRWRRVRSWRVVVLLVLLVLLVLVVRVRLLVVLLVLRHGIHGVVLRVVRRRGGRDHRVRVHLLPLYGGHVPGKRPGKHLFIQLAPVPQQRHRARPVDEGPERQQREHDGDGGEDAHRLRVVHNDLDEARHGRERREDARHDVPRMQLPHGVQREAAARAEAQLRHAAEVAHPDRPERNQEDAQHDDEAVADPAEREADEAEHEVRHRGGEHLSAQAVELPLGVGRDRRAGGAALRRRVVGAGLVLRLRVRCRILPFLRGRGCHVARSSSSSSSECREYSNC
mmetsp:Transcript_25807/g.79623  ORF Transcript_25807/g.79623 Transcript_25807/m.79623 type:complete len:351 (+) Transcript_25807:316-1368(+)